MQKLTVLSGGMGGARFLQGLLHAISTGRLPGSTSTGDPGVQKETTSDPQGGTQNIGFIEPDDWFAFDRRPAVTPPG